MDNLKLMGWNINQRSNFANNTIIPPVVIITIKEMKADIIVLTEFFKVKNYNDFVSDLEKENYTVFLDPRKAEENINQVLIAITNKLDTKKSGKVEWLSSDIKGANPNFLKIEVSHNNESLTIIGTRIRVDDCSNTDFINRKSQFNSLLSHIGDNTRCLEKVIVIGDFNHGAIKNESNENYDYADNVRKDYNYQMIRRLFQTISYDTHTPNYGKYGDKFSWVMKNPVIKIKEDHIISKGVSINCVDYNWDFVTSNNGYGKLKPEDYKSHLTGLPDHAILVASMTI